MSANAANVELSYSEGELPPRTPPQAPAPAAADTRPAGSPLDTPVPTDAASTPPAESLLDEASTQPAAGPSVAAPSSAESPAKEKPRFSPIGKTLWANERPTAPEPTATEPPVSTDTPVSTAQKPGAVSAGTQTPARRDGTSPPQAKEETSLNAEEAEKQKVSEEAEDAGEKEQLEEGSIFLKEVRRLPVVQCSTSLYRRARSNSLLATPMILMECAASVATLPAKVAIWPVANVCPLSLHLLDWTLYKGLRTVETIFPCIAVPLDQVCSETKTCCVNCVCCCPRAVKKTVSAFYPKNVSP